MNIAWEFVWAKNNITNYNTNTIGNFLDDLKLEFLKQHLPEHGKILEVGAGSGSLLCRVGLMRPNEYMLLALDSAKNSTILSKNNILSSKLCGFSVRADAFKLPIKNNSVNTIMSGGLLEHFKENECDLIVHEMVRVLKPGGLFYADIVPNKFSLASPLKSIGKRSNISQDPDFENNLSMETWQNILTKANLRSINISSALVIPPTFIFKPKALLNLLYKSKKIIRKLDNTFLSNLFGFEYYCIGIK